MLISLNIYLGHQTFSLLKKTKREESVKKNEVKLIKSWKHL